MSKLLSAYKTRFGAKGHAVSVNTGTSEVFKVLRILLLSNLIECRQSRYSQSLNLRRVLNFNDNSDCVATQIRRKDDVGISASGPYIGFIVINTRSRCRKSPFKNP